MPCDRATLRRRRTRSRDARAHVGRPAPAWHRGPHVRTIWMDHPDAQSPLLRATARSPRTRAIRRDRRLQQAARPRRLLRRGRVLRSGRLRNAEVEAMAAATSPLPRGRACGVRKRTRRRRIAVLRSRHRGLPENLRHRARTVRRVAAQRGTHSVRRLGSRAGPQRNARRTRRRCKRTAAAVRRLCVLAQGLRSRSRGIGFAARRLTATCATRRARPR